MFETGTGVITVLPMIKPDNKDVLTLLEETREVMISQLMKD